MNDLFLGHHCWASKYVTSLLGSHCWGFQQWSFVSCLFFFFQVTLLAFNECDIQLTRKTVPFLRKERFGYDILHGLLLCNKYFRSIIVNSCYVVTGRARNSNHVFGSETRWMYPIKTNLKMLFYTELMNWYFTKYLQYF